MKKKTIYFLFLYLIFSVKGYTQEPQWVVYNYATTGIPLGSCNKIAFDKVGGAWFSNDFGVIHFDGQNWELFDTSNTFYWTYETDFVTMAVDENNIKYTASSSPGELWHYNDTLWDVVPLGWVGRVYDVEVDKYNRKWVTFEYLEPGGTEIMILSDTSMQVITSNIPGVSMYNARDIYLDDNQPETEAWLSCSDIVHYTTDTIIKYTSEEILGFTNVHFKDICMDDTGNVWVGSDNGLLKYDRGSAWTIYDKYNSVFPDTTDSYIVSVCKDKNGKIWAGSNRSSGGLICIDGSSWIILNVSNSPLIDGHIGSIAVDEFNNKWIASWGGIFIYNEDGVNIPEPTKQKSKKKKIHVAPNPLLSDAIVEFNLQSSSSTYMQVFDATGKLCYQTKLENPQIGENQIKLNLANLQGGLYIIKLFNNQDFLLTKFLKTN